MHTRSREEREEHMARPAARPDRRGDRARRQAARGTAFSDTVSLPPSEEPYSPRPASTRRPQRMDALTARVMFQCPGD
ncbi:hypothetical protein ACF061_02340 [Streptomyces sp. NPDC015220]|uniref:hypothetical protein n=1 Tax=Streptomyces sp. NPDC015220 TaxID=3364947 RepID=UPI0036F7E983